MSLSEKIQELKTYMNTYDYPMEQKYIHEIILECLEEIEKMSNAKPNGIRCICYEKFTQNHAEGAD